MIEDERYHGGLYLRKTINRLYFGSSRVKLQFSVSSGQLLSVYWNGMLIADSKLQEEVTLETGGQMESNINLTEKNYKYPSMVCVNSSRVGEPGEMLAYRLKRLMDGLELSIDVRCGDFTIRKFYLLSSQSVITRRFEITYNGIERTSLQYLHLSTMGIMFRENGLAVVEAPLYNLPGSLRLTDQADHSKDFQCSPYMLSSNSILLHNEENTLTMSVWSGNIREQFNELVFAHWNGCCAITQKFHINAYMEPGECICTGDSRLQLTSAPWEDCLKELSCWHEHNGQRCKPTHARLLKETLILETEIGIVEFPEGVKHDSFADVDALIDGLTGIRESGFNTLLLMPAFPYPGYTIYDLHQPEIQYNTRGRLRELVERAHGLGLRVILDVVLHGCVDREIARWNMEHYSIRQAFFSSWQNQGPEVSPLRVQHPDWFIREDNGQIFRKYTWLFDLAHPGFQDYLVSALQLYVEAYGVDGFRFDAPQWAGAPNRSPELPYLPSKGLSFGTWELFHKARKAVDPLKRELIWLNEWEGLMWRDVTDLAYSYSSYFKWDVLHRERITGRLMQRFYDVRSKALPEQALYVHFSDNHDTWFMGEKGLFSYNKHPLGYTRIMLAASLFAEGAFMSYAGFEKGDEAFFRQVLHIRASLDLFSRGTCDYGRVQGVSEHLFCIYWEYAGQAAIICANVSEKSLVSGLETERSIPGSFTNLLHEEGVVQPDRILFQPYEIKILLSSPCLRKGGTGEVTK
ncbi:MAG: Alpha amylase [Paenibacillaceae bacterium]|jgi:hypothetical protein|nr:Alpha amylase [Paenibacillaceae bacterium]